MMCCASSHMPPLLLKKQRAPHHVLQKLASCAAGACTDSLRRPVNPGAQHLTCDAAIQGHFSLFFPAFLLVSHVLAE